MGEWGVLARIAAGVAAGGVAGVAGVASGVASGVATGVAEPLGLLDLLGVGGGLGEATLGR